MEELSPMRERIAQAVRRIGWAYVLLHLHINLGTLDILPDWAGYLMILSALPALAEWSPSAKLLKPLGVFLCANASLQWLVKLIGFSASTTAATANLLSLYHLLCDIIYLYFHFQLLTDIANTAHIVAYDGEASLLKTRTWYVVLLTGIQLILYLPTVPQLLTFFLLIVNLVIAFILCRQMLHFGNWLRREPEDDPDCEVSA